MTSFYLEADDVALVGPDALPGAWPLVRRAASADLLAALHARSIAPAWSAAAWRRLLAAPGRLAVVAWAAPDRAVGVASAGQAGADIDIETLAVLPEARRCGVGRLLVHGLAVRGRAVGASRLILEVAVDNGPALGLYRALGFAEVGRRPGYYKRASAPPVEAAVMACDLAALDPDPRAHGWVPTRDGAGGIAWRADPAA